MARSHTLPREVAYLAGLIDAMEAQSDSEIDESQDTTAICIALKERIEASSPADAESILANDLITLEGWLSAMPDHPAHFLVGILSGGAELVRYLRDFRPPKGWKPRKVKLKRRFKRVEMETPPGFSCRREGSGLFMQHGEEFGSRTCVGIGFGSRSPSNRQILEGIKGYPRTQIDEVSFGKVSGLRISREGVTGSFLLKVEKAEIWVTIEGNCDLVEPYLSTLAVAESEL